MTLCTGSPAERSLERYVQGTLPELEASIFEEHYFECPVCLAQVEALQAVTAQLALHPVVLHPADPPKTAATRLFAWPLPAAAGAIAAALILGFVVLRTPHPAAPNATAQTPIAPAPQPAPTTANLADLTLPPFEAMHLRGETPDPNFTAGMKAYTSHDCPRAIQPLAHVAPQSDDAIAARFYLGLCQMSLGSSEKAAATLHTVEKAGDVPQREAALFYLAQLALIRNDATTARRELTRTIALRGDFEKRARAQLDKLP